PSEVALRRPVVDERVEPFVHPRIATLVRADEHRKPFVAELVREYPELVLPLLDRRDEREHRILHPFHEPFHRRRVRPGVRAPRLAEVLDREPRHLVRLLPRRGAPAAGPHPRSGSATAPVPATRTPAGRVSDTSKSPYSR